MSADLHAIEQTLWTAANRLWANMDIKLADFSAPFLGLYVIRHSERRFADVEASLVAQGKRPDELERLDKVAEGALRVGDGVIPQSLAAA